MYGHLLSPGMTRTEAVATDVCTLLRWPFTVTYYNAQCKILETEDFSLAIYSDLLSQWFSSELIWKQL